MTDFTAFDGSQFKSKRAKERFEKKALLKMFHENNNTCPWAGQVKCVDCHGYIEDMENCFKLELKEEPLIKLVFS